MSSAAAPLRDEVCDRWFPLHFPRTNGLQGTHAQVALAGAIAGLVSRFCIAPLDVLKIRLQLQYHSLAEPLYRRAGLNSNSPAGVVAVAREILRNEGLTAFWKGNIPAEGLYLSYGAVQFLAYRSSNELIDRLGNGRLPGTVKSFLAGAVAGTAATTTTYPLDLLRTRFAAQGTEKVYAGLAASVRDITRHEGYTGFFRGLSAGIGQVVPYMGLFFALYEGLKPALAPLELPFSSSDAVTGVIASVLSKSAVFPLDTVRKRLQVQGPTRAKYIGVAKMPVYDRGILNTISVIVKLEGARGLYRGLAVSLIKAAPASAVTMWTYERCLGLFRTLNEEFEESKEAK